MLRKVQTFSYLLTLFFFVGCQDNESEPIQDSTQFTATNFVSGLKMPVDMSLDEEGQDTLFSGARPFLPFTLY